MLNRVRLALLAGIALGSVPAMAADLPMKAVPYTNPEVMGSWTGGYIGAQIGYAWGSDDFDVVSRSFGEVISPTIITATLGNAMSGFVGGARAGYDFQLQGSNIVFGVVTEFNGSDIKGSGHSGITTSGTTVASLNTGASINDFGTGNARIGYAFGNSFMPYLTGGAAYSNVKANLNGAITGSTIGIAGYSSATKLGYDIGAGIETRLGKWSMFLEGKWVDTGTLSVPIYTTGPNHVLVATGSQKTGFGLLEGGFNYRF